MTGRPAVNLLWCVPGVVGGTEPYLVRQLLGLVEIGIGRHARPVLHCLRSFADAHPELLAEFDARLAPVSGRLRALRVGAEHSWLANATRSASLVHHAGGTVPALGRGPVVLTIHDLQYLHLPGNFSAPKRRYLQATVPRSVRRADVIATPTRFVAATVIEGFGVDQASCVVVPHSLPATAGAWGGDADGLRRRYGLGEHPVAVYPAITHPHKNHRFLVDLLASGLVDDELRLVLIGGAGAAEIGLRSAIRSAGVAERVIRPGRGERRRPRRPDRDRRRDGVPLVLRGLRSAGDRGDGARHTSRLQ